jgi:hypothetical protein
VGVDLRELDHADHLPVRSAGLVEGDEAGLPLGRPVDSQGGLERLRLPGQRLDPLVALRELALQEGALSVTPAPGTGADRYELLARASGTAPVSLPPFPELAFAPAALRP